MSIESDSNNFRGRSGSSERLPSNRHFVCEIQSKSIDEKFLAAASQRSQLTALQRERE